MEGQVINRALKKLIQDNDLPDVVFHSFRHASITYKLKWNGGDMKSVQGDSGHARMDMVADVYSHIIDEDRRYNAQKFEEQFYNAKVSKMWRKEKLLQCPSLKLRLNFLTQWQRFKKRAKLKKKKADSQMIELQESVKKYGILNSLIVRPRRIFWKCPR